MFARAFQDQFCDAGLPRLVLPIDVYCLIARHLHAEIDEFAALDDQRGIRRRIAAVPRSLDEFVEI